MYCFGFIISTAESLECTVHVVDSGARLFDIFEASWAYFIIVAIRKKRMNRTRGVEAIHSFKLSDQVKFFSCPCIT